MALERSARPLARCIRCTRHSRIPSRSISTTPPRAQEDITTLESAVSNQPPLPPLPFPFAATSKGTVNREKLSTPRKERLLAREARLRPIGSRRRRAALATSREIPFSQLPYQCFQEARKVLIEDRAGKVAEIEDLRAKINKWNAAEVPPEREAMREKRIGSWNQRIEQLKILADINDPLVKKNFEDGFGDMNKPIYRHLADKKWRSHKREILMQRIEQMNVVPDILPSIDPTVSTKLSFSGGTVQPGTFVLAANSEKAPELRIQTYEKGKKLVTIAVVTPDVPNVEKDGFDYRCHFLAANVPIEPTSGYVHLGRLQKEASIIQRWLPPHSQKGAPYQRMAVFILEQPSSVREVGATGRPDDATTTEANSSLAAAANESTTELEGTSATAVEQPTQETSPSEVASLEPDAAVADATPKPTSSESTRATPPSAEAIVNAPSPQDPSKPIGPGISDAINPTKTPIPERLDVAAIKKDPRYSQRENFILRSFVDRYRLKPIGVDLFRTQWDETTAAVMRRNRIVGYDVEFKRKRVYPLPYQRLKGERYR